MHTNENFPNGDGDSHEDSENELSLFELVEAIDRIEAGE